MADNFANLAINGGAPAIDYTLRPYTSIGKEEVAAATRVVESGSLSKFVASWGPEFYGGPEVLRFEKECEAFFRVKHAIAVNSWTSGLVAAVGAIGLEPGDEVIVSPWTMRATAMAILHWNAIPVFADIDPITFCLDPESVIKNISPYTKAILSVDIFGQSADVQRLTEISKKYNLRLISDSAQSPGALVDGNHAGTVFDIGGFSLNYHKHINTGEGGVLFTNDDDLALRLKLIRNHAEAIVGPMGYRNLANMIGHNFRMGEIEAAIGVEQLKKLPSAIERRSEIAHKLNEELHGLKGLTTPITSPGNTHIFYKYGLVLDPDVTEVSKFRIVESLRAEGVPGLSTGYVNVHLFPIFQHKIAYGSHGFPWTSDICKREVSYAKGICPNAEKLHELTYIGFDICEFELSDGELDDVIKAFKKVWGQLDKLK